MHYIYRSMCVYKGFCYSSKLICVGLKVGMSHVHQSRKLKEVHNFRLSLIQDACHSLCTLQYGRMALGGVSGVKTNQSINQARVISRVFNAYTSVESN